MSKYQKALVVDASFTARSVISTERAFVICYKGNAEVIADHPETFSLINPELIIYKPSIISYSASEAIHYKTALRGDNNRFIYNYMIKKINCDINPSINYTIKKGIAIIKWKLYDYMIKRETEKRRMRKEIDYDDSIINWLSLLIGIYLYFDEKDEINFKQSSLLEEITQPFTKHSF